MRTPLPFQGVVREQGSRQAYSCRSTRTAFEKSSVTELGSNFTDFKKLGFRDEAALTKAHKSIDLKYLRKLNRMAAQLLHDDSEV